MNPLPLAHRRRALGIGLAGALLATLGTAQAQDYGSRPLTIVVPFAAGSGTDTQARIVGQALASEYKITVLVENKAGANGFIAAQHVARAAPDGHTVLMTTNTTHAANEHLFKKLPYDPVKDFTPVTLLGLGYMYLVVAQDSPVKTVADLVAAARKAPGKLNFGSGSSSSRVGSEMLKQLAGLDVAHVPYKSNPLAVTDLIGGQINFMFLDAPTAMPHLNGGKLRALAVSGTTRMQATPSVPTAEEAGVKGFDVSYWFAVYAPPGLPAAMTQRLNQMFIKASLAPEVKQLQERSSAVAATSTPEELARFQAAESLKWGKVIKAAGIEPE
ncbi:Bug family tripartite tricarboxylate transporter substrate binding protein [Pseudorhodoferax sp.]|uniref:Bug family tripartite tricarboxylate transporter substrate binding protein n=1 Tax=Pseudorhodoferax sp. TaxID=1993553 RepID=UPI002DD69CD4|nr:tripartite tricarboxylate transporter substrate binding protein [Pseudorhodoferax sp.]